MGFDYRTSTGLEKQTLEGQTKSCVHQDLGERSNVRPKTTKLLEESIRHKMHSVECGNDFLAMTQKEQQ